MDKHSYDYSTEESKYNKYDNAAPDITGRYVKAIYNKAESSTDYGNPLIEALPGLPDDMQMKMLYNIPLADYDPKEIAQKIRENNSSYLIHSVLNLRYARVLLPRAKRLEEFVHLLLTESYHERTQIVDTETDIPVTIGGTNLALHSQLVVDDLVGGPPGGIALLGYAGSGKTNLIRTLMSHYPGLIEHSTPENPIFYQIPILLIECSPFANMSALWNDFGSALDKRLGRIDNYYHDKIASKKNLADKIALVINYIKLFNVGMIAIDEIEHLNFTGAKNDSFQEILTLQNKTNVGICVIGNEEAYRQMFADLRQQRRFNKMIHGSDYCHDREFNYSLILQIMKYQWFEPRIDFAKHPKVNEYLNVMYKSTAGIIDQIITLWELVNYDWIKRKNKPEITPEYIQKVSEKYLPDVTRELLNNLDDIAAGTKRQKENRMAEAMMQRDLNSAEDKKEQENVLEYYLSDTETVLKQLTDHAVTAIGVFFKQYTSEAIGRAVRKVYGDNYKENLTADEITVKALTYLQKEEAKIAGKPVKRPNDTPDITAYLSDTRR